MMSMRTEMKCFARMAIAAILAVISTLAAAQSRSTKQAHHAGDAPNVYESDEIKLRIPVGWRLSRSSGGDRREGAVMLERSGYRLSLGYDTGHASGIEGGRFIEAFSGLEDAWTCSGYLREFPQPASRQLIFINLILDTGDARVRENCAIPKELGVWTEKGGAKEYKGTSRWFGGYFRAAEGGYFFDSKGADCGLKAYTLTSDAAAPAQFPIADSPMFQTNPALENVIREAIDIVNSIQYKRCPPI